MSQQSTRRKIILPDGVRFIIESLNKSGYEAYAVGGCVRDTLRGAVPNDWDICTAAKPDTVISVFGKNAKAGSGLKHGTVTVLADGEAYEVTTFRVDGEYSDNRRPDNVTFTERLTDDLSRRDFTINAMAYSDEAGLADPFGGFRDLENGVIRCVGKPERRFAEDALRILRALRFASVLAFTIDSGTAAAIHHDYRLLQNISAERITMEITRMLTGKHAYEIMSEYEDVCQFLVPDCTPEMLKDYRGTDTVSALVLFLWNTKIPKILKLDSKTHSAVSELLRYKDDDIENTSKSITMYLHKLGRQNLKRLLDIRGYPDTYSETLNDVLERDPCYKLSHLKITGNDVITALNIAPGTLVGEILNAVLDAVMVGELENVKEYELAWICRKYKNKRLP